MSKQRVSRINEEGEEEYWDQQADAVGKNSYGGEMPVSLQNNLSELDTLLADLNNAKYSGDTGVDTGSRSVVSTAYAYGDYYSDLDSCVGDQKPPERPPPPKPEP